MLTITIMAAGEGKRMNSNVPKVLHKFNGIPMLIRIIIEASKLNPDKIIIITGKFSELIKHEVNMYFENVNESEKMINKLLFVNQLTPNGTADAIKYTLPYYNDNEDILILNGDMPLISSELLLKFINSESSYMPRLLIAKLDNPHGYGRIIYDMNNFFVEFLYKFVLYIVLLINNCVYNLLLFLIQLSINTGLILYMFAN